MDYILDMRVLLGTYDLIGTVPEIMRELVDKCCIHPDGGDEAERRIIPGLSLEKKQEISGLKKIHFVKTGGSLLEALNELKQKYRVDFGIGNNMEFWTRPMY